MCVQLASSSSLFSWRERARRFSYIRQLLRYLFPGEVNREYEHALRRSWFSALCFSLWGSYVIYEQQLKRKSFLCPLSASLVPASAASGTMVSNDEVEPDVHWWVALRKIESHPRSKVPGFWSWLRRPVHGHPRHDPP